MAFAAKLVLLLLATLHSFCNARSSVSTKEYLELKKQLKSIIKPAISTIKTKDGDIFDCVDIYKQPAFDHPALKNHQIEMEPFVPEGLTTPKLLGEIGLPEGGCPDGSVPIWRATMKELILSRSLIKHFVGGCINRTSTLIAENSHFAYMQNHEEQFHGMSAVMNLWYPAVEYPNQLSSAFIRLANPGSPEDNHVWAGYMVYGDLYGDLKSRIFEGWSVGTNGCLNIYCPGFVQVSRRLAPGIPLAPPSEYEGQQHEFEFSIHKAASGNWWLTAYNEPLGYWPKEIFTNFDVGTNGDWGGFVHAPDDSPVMPPMGSGHFSWEGWKKACYMRGIKFVDATNLMLDVTHMDWVQTAPDCYNIKDIGFIRFNDWGRSFYFGGPGGLLC